MKLRRPQRPDTFNNWHSYAVSGHFFLAEFESDDGRVVHRAYGFHTTCCVRGHDAIAALERLLPVVSSWAAESLVSTAESRIVSTYCGRLAEPFGKEMVAGVRATELQLKRELPVIARIAYSLGNIWAQISNKFQRVPI